MDRFIHIIPPLAIAVFMIGAMLWSARRTTRAGIAEASSLDLDTSHVEREVFNNLDQCMRRERCLRSRMILRDEAMDQMRPWRLLQRPWAKHPELPAGWTIEGFSTPLPPTLRAAFAAVTTQWKEGLFEVEWTPTEVCVYWHPLGGPTEARAVRAHLDRIVDALTADRWLLTGAAEDLPGDSIRRSQPAASV